MFDLWGGNREENIREAKNMVLRFRQYNDLQEQEGKRVDTTKNASITELFPAIAFNSNKKPSTVEEFKKFIYTLDINSPQVKKSWDPKDQEKAIETISDLSSMEERFVKTKMENAIGVVNFLYELHATKPINKVVWGYRAKPRGVPKNHAGDIFVFFKDKDVIGVSLKAGTAKSREPLKNTYVGTQYRALKIDTKDLQYDLWDKVYSKLPGIEEVATKDNYVKNSKVTKLYIDYFVENETEANKLYHEMLVVCREHFCKVINDLDTDTFIKWVQNTFNLQRKEDKVPLILVKAVKMTAEQKSDDIVDMLPLVTNHHAYLSKKSVQEYLIDIHSPSDKKTMRMDIRSSQGVRPEKGTSGQGRLGQYLELKMLYRGVI